MMKNSSGCCGIESTRQIKAIAKKTVAKIKNFLKT